MVKLKQLCYTKGIKNKENDSNSKIKGLKYFAIIDIIKQKFDKDVDVIEKSEIDKNSKIEKEIERTGIVIYEK